MPPMHTAPPAGSMQIGRGGKPMEETMRQERPRPGSLPLVYSCSGCSSAAQMANALALRLDADRRAEMSCIAGVGGGVPGLVRTARSGRPILALDGCILHCVRACLARAGVEADTHITLSEHGVRKRRHQSFDPHEADRLYRELVVPAARKLGACAGGDRPSAEGSGTTAPAGSTMDLRMAG